MQIQSKTVDEYIEQLGPAVMEKLTKVRELVRTLVPEAIEVINYGVIGYKMPPGNKRGFMFIGGYTSHLSIYPVPHNPDAELAEELKLHIAGRGTLRFLVDQPLPIELIKQIVQALKTDSLRQ
jgi:uncharacterized protein YdhG (YjbR/CyaY superfamily)